MEGREAVEEEGEEVVLRYWMELRMMEEEVAAEAAQELRHELVEGEAEESLGLEGEAAERTCLVGMEGEVGAQRWGLWRGEEEAGHHALGQEEGEEGLRCGVVVGEEARLWMEEVEELERERTKF